MPSKFSYDVLAETNDRLKREARQYLDSLDVIESDVQDKHNEENSTPDHPGATQPSDAGETEDEVPDMTFQRTGTFRGDDDDSLIAMAKRLDDASVISYSSFDVRSQYTNEDDEESPILALPCSTGNTGIKAKKIFPKESRFGPEDKAKKRAGINCTATSKDRRKQRQNLKQAYDEIGKKANLDQYAEKMPSSTKAEVRKIRSTSRDRERDTTKGFETKWKSNSFNDSKPMPSRRRSMEDTTITMSRKATEGRIFHTVEKRAATTASQLEDKGDTSITRRNQQKPSPLNNSECTVQTDNKKDRAERFRGKKLKGKTRGRRSKCESDDESMRGVGCNVRIHTISDKNRSDRMPTKNSEARTRSNSKTRKKDDSVAMRSRSSSTPPVLKNKNQSEKLSDCHNLYASESDDEVHSVYDSDCNTEFFYESTEEEWSSEDEELPMVGTSVSKAVEHLNNKSIGFKMKNILGIKG